MPLVCLDKLKLSLIKCHNILLLSDSNYSFFDVSSGRRCNQHSTRSFIHVCIPLGCQWCSHRPCYISVCSAKYIYAQLSFPWYLNFPFASFDPNYPLFSNQLCRYLISVILLWRLLEQVDLIPPSINHLQLDRFLKNGKGLFCLDQMIYKKKKKNWAGQSSCVTFF